MRRHGLCLAVFVLSIMVSGCVAAPELVKVSFPDDAAPGETFAVRWAIAERAQSDAAHSELHWSVDDKSLDLRAAAHRTGDGPYHEPDCGPMVDCAPGPHFVAHIAVPESAGGLFYRIHVEGSGWEAHSQIIEVKVG